MRQDTRLRFQEAWDLIDGEKGIASERTRTTVRGEENHRWLASDSPTNPKKAPSIGSESSHLLLPGSDGENTVTLS